MKNVAIIMAGGKGERFWPMSTLDRPKQFLKLTDSDDTMIQMTIKRILPLINLEDIFIVTNEKYKNLISQQLTKLPKENIIYEPLSKNTAPCVALATSIIKKKYGNANIIVLASDHIIKNEKLFLDTLKLSLDNLTSNNIITLGIVPERAETGYGYIKMADKKAQNSSIYNVEKFVEKPNYENAKKYYESGNYLWNSGMFIWNNEFMNNCVKNYLPEIYFRIEKIYNSIGTENFKKILETEYSEMESISIDYGIMEKVKNIEVIPGNFGWDDVGSWLSIERLRKINEDSNIIDGNIVCIETNNCTIINNDDDLISTVGLDNLIIVKNDKKTLIISKDRVNEIKTLTKKIKEEKGNKYL